MSKAKKTTEADPVADAADSIVEGNAPATPVKISPATQLVMLASARYRLGCAVDGEPFAIPKSGPQIVRQLRGGRQSLRAELAAAFFANTEIAASQSALADACSVLEGTAQQCEPSQLYLRVAPWGEGIALDLGDTTGRCVVINGEGWSVVEQPPVLFRRTQLTGALPEPARGGDFGLLWAALNVAERYRPVLLAVLVASLLPGIPHPIVLLTGEQGTGKSTATARLAAIVDPSPAQLRKAPADVEQWTAAAAGSWVVALDNLSGVPDWLSDALCRGSTGDGDVRRRLYTDGDLHVFAFRRVLIINGVDVGALRGDLADRLVHLVLALITDDMRLTDEEMTEQWRNAHPRVLGALLDLTVKVLAVLPTVKLATMPRMADFARVVAAVDQINDTEGLKTYLGLRDELAQDAATSDPVLVALAEKVTEEFIGTAAELLELITPVDAARPAGSTAQRLPKGWPSTARALTGALTRQAPTLRQLGWGVGETEKDSRARAKRWVLTPPPSDTSAPSVSAQLPSGASVANDARSDARTHARTLAPPVISGNTPAASVASVASGVSPTPLSALLKPVEGETQQGSPVQRSEENTARNARNARNGHSVAGQSLYAVASVGASETDDARTCDPPHAALLTCDVCRPALLARLLTAPGQPVTGHPQEVS